MKTPAAEDLELARQISLRRGYLAERRPAARTVPLVTWYRQRRAVAAELADLEKEAAGRHGSVDALLAAAGLPARCACESAHGGPVPARHCPACRSEHELAVLAADSQ